VNARKVAEAFSLRAAAGSRCHFVPLNCAKVTHQKSARRAISSCLTTVGGSARRLLRADYHGWIAAPAIDNSSSQPMRDRGAFFEISVKAGIVASASG